MDINFEKQKHASITCVYRAQGQNISTFCDNIVSIIDDGHRNGKKFVCGDFNINILQHESDDSVRQFLDSMYALGLYPLITKPTRITRTTATIIDKKKKKKKNFIRPQIGKCTMHHISYIKLKQYTHTHINYVDTCALTFIIDTKL